MTEGGGPAAAGAPPPLGAVRFATARGAGALGALGLLGFVVVERRSRHPMLPLDIFASHQFTSANIVTLAVYAALGGTFFLLAVHLQSSLGYSPTEAGVAMFPITILMLGLSSRVGQWATRIGPRLPMSLGPMVVALGLVLMTRIEPGRTYVTAVLPAVVVFGLGLSLTVAPLTATVLASAEDRHSGVASGVNNAVARTAQLLAVAVLPVASGITGDDLGDPVALTSGFATAALITAGLAALGGLVAWATISNDVLRGREDRLEDHDDPASCGHSHCSLDAPPLRDRHRAPAA